LSAAIRDMHAQQNTSEESSLARFKNFKLRTGDFAWVFVVTVSLYVGLIHQ
jgi:hypothetical protein